MVKVLIIWVKLIKELQLKKEKEIRIVIYCCLLYLAHTDSELDAHGCLCVCVGMKTYKIKTHAEW